MMRDTRFLRALAALVPLVQGCGAADPAADHAAAIDVSLGWINQGPLTHGMTDAMVWDFRYTDWWNSGMKLKATGVVEGHLVASWDRTESCTSSDLESPTPLSRSCGWYGAGWATCFPGTTVSVGAGGCGLGSSTSDSMLRICKGDKPCTAAAALAANDNTPSGACNASDRPKVSFTCPAAPPGTPSKFFVMVSPKADEAGFSYSIAATGGFLPPLILHTELSDGPCSKCPSQLVGTTLPATSSASSDPVTFRIAAVKTQDASTSFYTLEKADGSAQPLCLAGSPPVRGAIPMLGRWIANGTHHDTTASFTFACTAGVLAKCYRIPDVNGDEEGYRPWAVGAGDISLRDYHQACTRAARADYCGDGGSHTVDGTPINIYDRIPHLPETPQSTVPIEAVWRRDLVVPASSTAMLLAGPVCLAKKRWETIPINGCGALTPDPRTKASARYCDDRPVDHSPNGWFSSDAQDLDNLIANRSAFIDAGLWRWKRESGNDYRSTTKLPTTGAQPDPAYLFAPTAIPAEPHLIGSIYALVTSDGVRPHHTIQLYTHHDPGKKDYLTNTNATPPSAGYSSTVEEGWILAPSCPSIPGCPTSKPLRLYRDPATGDHATDTSPPGASYQELALLGYLPR